MRAGDILIDGGNSYYIDDIRRAKELGRKAFTTWMSEPAAASGVGARLLHDDWRRTRGGEHLDPIFGRWRPGNGDIPRTPGHEKIGTHAELGYLHCGSNGAGHFVKMVHNGIEYGIMAAYAEGFGVLRAANIGKPHMKIDAETTPLRNPEYYHLRPRSGQYRRGLAPR